MIFERAAGHFWTIYPHLYGSLARATLTQPAQPWRHAFEDPAVGTVHLSGLLFDHSSDSLVIGVHGLGGSVQSPYMKRLVLACSKQNLSCLLLAVRGYDRSGDDLSHGGLWQDIDFALQNQMLRRFKSIYLVGYSIGGHVCLHAALNLADARLKAVVAVCPPLILQLAQRAIDRRSAWLYRSHVLSGLKEIYQILAKRGRAPTPYAQVKQVQSIYDWDRLTVVPRHGFQSVEHYYEQASIAPKLANIQLPTLIVTSSQDPMLPADVYPWNELHFSPCTLHRHLDSGGHVAFPNALDLGFGATSGLENQILHWLQNQGTDN